MLCHPATAGWPIVLMSHQWGWIILDSGLGKGLDLFPEPESAKGSTDGGRNEWTGRRGCKDTFSR